LRFTRGLRELHFTGLVGRRWLRGRVIFAARFCLVVRGRLRCDILFRSVVIFTVGRLIGFGFVGVSIVAVGFRAGLGGIAGFLFGLGQWEQLQREQPQRHRE
jgi:hypothetical protein